MSAIIESLYLVIVIIRTMVDHVTYSNPLYIFGSPVVGITWGILFFIFANQIKANEKYTRWMGIEPILRQVMVILAFVENALWNLENGYAYSLSDMLPSTLLIKGPAFLIGLFFAVIFFTGMQKKTWPFVVRLILFGIAQISNLIVAGYQIVNYIAHDYELFYNAQTIISSIYSTLYGIAFLMLMAPNKKSSNTPKTP